MTTLAAGFVAGWQWDYAPVYPQPTATPPPAVPVATPSVQAVAPLDPQQLAAVLYDKAIPLGYSTRSQWGGRIIEGPVFSTIGSERAVSFIAGYYIPVNFWDATRTVTELYFRGQLAWTQSEGARLSGLNVGMATAAGAQTVRFATGTLAQTPDAWSVARYGAQAVAYVPLVTATFENIRIAQFGNIVPFTSVTVEDTAAGSPGDLVAWSDAIEVLARHDGRSPEEFETIDVSGGINALILGSKIDFIEFLSGMRKHKPHWNIRTAEKLTLIEKGTFSLDLTLELAKLVNHDAQPIVVHSSDAFDKPREMVCHYLDVDRDYEPSNARIAEDIDPVVATDALQSESYEIPVASSADIVNVETSFAYYTGEMARTKSEFTGMAHYLGLEPGDCYKWTSAAGRLFYHRVNEIVRRADFTIDVKGEGFLNCAIAEELPPITPPPITGVTWDTATAAAALSGGNLVATSTGETSPDQGVRVATAAGKTSGKYYFEGTIETLFFAANFGIGVATPLSTYAGMGDNATTGAEVFHGSGNIYSNGTNTGNTIGAVGPEFVVGVAVDLDNRKFWAKRVSGTPGNWNGSGTANPATNVGGITIPAGTMVPILTFGGTNGSIGIGHTVNFGASAFTGAVPSGFTSGWPV